jgi:hypothetical protein
LGGERDLRHVREERVSWREIDEERGRRGGEGRKEERGRIGGREKRE